METKPARIVYVVDSSALINVQRTYPLPVFSGVWEQLSELAADARLISAREVFNELERGGDDEIFQWAKRNKSLFQDPDGEQIEVAREIVNDPKFKNLFDIEGEKPDADPYIIALAAVQQRRSSMFPNQYVVVADEARADPKKKPRIPNVCTDSRYHLECIKILDMFKDEGWEFVKKAGGETA